MGTGTPTKVDMRNLRDFIAASDAAIADGWRKDESGEPHLPCRSGKRLCGLGLLELVRGPRRAYAGFMGSSYYPALYRLSARGRAT